MCHRRVLDGVIILPAFQMGHKLLPVKLITAVALDTNISHVTRITLKP